MTNTLPNQYNVKIDFTFLFTVSENVFDISVTVLKAFHKQH